MIGGLDTQFRRFLEKEIDDELERHVDAVTNGATAVGDFATYRHEVGVISALRMVKRMCSEITAKMNEQS